MNTFTIIIFFIYLYGFGYTATRFLKRHDLETTILRLAMGLAIIPVLGCLFNIFRIPIDWSIFLILALIVPIYDLQNYFKNMKGRLTLPKPEPQTLVLFGIFIAMLIIYCTGSFAYPWLENDDPWNHAASSTFIALEKHIRSPQGMFQYLNPYPPGYNIIFALLRQINPSIYWVMKCVNGIIVSLSFLFFFIFVKELTLNKTKALWITFFLACIPCYLSHFIWSHALVITLLFPTFYLFIKSENDKRLIILSSIVVASMFLTQPTQCIKFCILIGFLMFSAQLCKRKIIKNIILSMIIGGVIALSWYGPIIKNYLDGKFKITYNNYQTDFGDPKNAGKELFRQFTAPKSGNDSRAYLWQDYIILSESNMINNPLGVGPTFALLAVVGLFIYIFKIKSSDTNERFYGLFLVLWFIFAFLGMNSITFNLPVGLFAYRFWMLFAIPTSFFAAEITYRLVHQSESNLKKYLSFAVIVTLIIATSGKAKYGINTAVWPYGIAWKSYDELLGYMWMRAELPAQTKVFAFYKNRFVIGHDMLADYWSDSYQKYLSNAFDLEISQLHQALQKNNFEYLIIGEREVAHFGHEAVNAKIEALNKSPLFQVVHTTKDAVILFKIINA